MGSNPACPTKPNFFARIAALNDALLAGRSATETLELWAARHFGVGPLTAARIPGPDRPPDPAARAILGTATSRYRHVRLGCGPLVLSVAENWYVPALLTPAMNAALEATSEPFGRVVAPLGCLRRTLEATMLDRGGDYVLEHRAALFDARGNAVSVVRERYTRDAVGEG